MNKKTCLLVLIASALPIQAFASACVIEHNSAYGDITTCYENVSMPEEEFSNACKNNTLDTYQMGEDEIIHTPTAKCSAPYLGACINGPLPYDFYYIKTDGIDFMKKGCDANNGTWLDKHE